MRPILLDDLRLHPPKQYASPSANACRVDGANTGTQDAGATAAVPNGQVLAEYAQPVAPGGEYDGRAHALQLVLAVWPGPLSEYLPAGQVTHAPPDDACDVDA